MARFAALAAVLCALLASVSGGYVPGETVSGLRDRSFPRRAPAVCADNPPSLAHRYGARGDPCSETAYCKLNLYCVEGECQVSVFFFFFSRCLSV